MREKLWGERITGPAGGASFGQVPAETAALGASSQTITDLFDVAAGFQLGEHRSGSNRVSSSKSSTASATISRSLDGRTTARADLAGSLAMTSVLATLTPKSYRYPG